MYQRTLLLRVLALALCLGLPLSLYAQAPPETAKTNPFTPALPDGPPGAHSDVDYSALNAEAWTLLGRQHADQLSSADAVDKDNALQNVIFFATQYPDQVRYAPAAKALYQIYRFDEAEAYRIMALAAINAIGDEATLQQLYQDVRHEKSARVRALTNAVLANQRRYAAR